MSMPHKSAANAPSHHKLSRRALAVTPLLLVAGIAGAKSAPARSGKRPPFTKPLSAEDRLDIQDLFARHAWCYDCSDEEAYLANFLPDAVVVAYDRSHQGKEAIREWYRFLVAIRTTEGDDWQHDAYHHRFDCDRYSCIVYSYATHFSSNSAAKKLSVRSAGYYVSECVKQNGIWLFRRHSVNRWDRQQLPWNKPLPWQQPA
jgi:SnoaL-like domain